MNTFRPLDTILILAILLIGGMQVYVLAAMPRGQSAASANPMVHTKTEQAPLTLLPNNVLAPIVGQVAAIESNAIIVKSTPEAKRILVSNETVIVKQGARKDAATFAKELNAFHQYSNDLAKDPEKNHDALTMLISPSPLVETQVSLSDIKAGDHVTAFTIHEGEALTATRVIISAK